MAKALPFCLSTTVFALSDHLRGWGWQVPAFVVLVGAKDLAVMRVVVREGFSRDLAAEFRNAIHRADALLTSPSAGSQDQAPDKAFAHQETDPGFLSVGSTWRGLSN